MILEQLKKDVDELVELCIKNNINPYNVTVEFVSDIMSVTLPGAVHKVEVKGRISSDD